MSGEGEALTILPMQLQVGTQFGGWSDVRIVLDRREGERREPYDTLAGEVLDLLENETGMHSCLATKPKLAGWHRWQEEDRGLAPPAARGVGEAGRVMLQLWRDGALIIVLATLILPGCAPLPKVEYWDGFFRHLHHPRYSFRVPGGWRQATISDYPSLGFNRRLFQTLDEAGRSVFLQRAELEMQGRDTVLISSRGAWIQVGSEAGPGGWYSLRDRPGFGLSEREQQAVWQRLSTGLMQTAPPADKPKLSLESMDLADYGENRALRLRFRSDIRRGSMHWTVLGFYGSSGMVTVAHVGVPEDREEGIAGLEVIAQSFRFQ